MKMFRPFRYLDARNLYKDIMGDKTPKEIINKIRPLLEEKTKKLVNECKKAREKLKDLPGTNYELGLYHLKNGNIEDAIMRFRMVIYLSPEKSEAYYSMARAFIMKDSLFKAREAIEQAIKLNPNIPGGEYILAKVRNPSTIVKIPSEIILENINRHSAQDTDITRNKAEMLVNIVLTSINDKNPNLTILDLGCGNGERGLILKQKGVSKKIIGVDLHKEKVQSAKKLDLYGDKIYDSIVEIDALEYLSNNSEKFDIIITGSIITYYLDIKDLTVRICNHLNKNGIFAIIIPKPGVEEGYKFNVNNDNFVHSTQRIVESLEETGLYVQDKKEKEIGDFKYILILCIRK